MSGQRATHELRRLENVLTVVVIATRKRDQTSVNAVFERASLVELEMLMLQEGSMMQKSGRGEISPCRKGHIKWWTQPRGLKSTQARNSTCNSDGVDRLG